jgi:hypothetical protein
MNDDDDNRTRSLAAEERGFTSEETSTGRERKREINHPQVGPIDWAGLTVVSSNGIFSVFTLLSHMEFQLTEPLPI